MIVVVLAGGSTLFWNLATGLATIFGGFISVVSALMLSWKIKKAGELAVSMPGKSLRTLYFGAVERFLFILVAFAFAIAVLKLLPLPVIVGFVAAQLSYVLLAKALN
jgi:ATP synthase protein I